VRFLTSRPVGEEGGPGMGRQLGQADQGLVEGGGMVALPDRGGSRAGLWC
jgi:hypothetical protein